MRAVSLVSRLELEFTGNVFKDAVTLGDVDNDTGNELIIANVAGDVAIYKGTSPKPWRTGSGYGMITSVVVGDILNEQKNYLITLTAEGWCSLFFVNKDGDKPPDEVFGVAETRKLIPCHTQRLMSNTKMALLADIDGDGALELVIGMTDRVVRSYRWTPMPPVESIKYPGMKLGGRLVAQNKWEFANQIGAVTLNSNTDGTMSLMVAQPGGTYIQLNCYSNMSSQSEPSSATSREPLEYHALSSTKMRNPNVSTEIVGNIRRKDPVTGASITPTLYAIATLDGTLMLLEGEEIRWSIQVDHQLFALTKLDLTGDGNEEVVVCSWDGHTYIINHEHQSLRFQFDDTVCTFTAGYYTLVSGEEAVPCLVYVTFNNRICIYHNVKVDQIPTLSLTAMVSDRPAVVDIMKRLGVDVSDADAVRDVIHWALYGQRPKT